MRQNGFLFNLKDVFFKIRRTLKHSLQALRQKWALQWILDIHMSELVSSCCNVAFVIMQKPGLVWFTTRKPSEAVTLKLFGALDRIWRHLLANIWYSRGITKRKVSRNVCAARDYSQPHHSERRIRCYPPSFPCGGAITLSTKVKKKKNRRRKSWTSRRRGIEMAASIKSRLGLIVRLANSVLKPPQNYLVTNLLFSCSVRWLC